MVAAKNDSQSAKKQDLVHLAILLVIALGIGIYIIATTVLIAQDGVGYVNNAKFLTGDFMEGLKRHWPGYPFLIFVLHSFTGLFYKTDGVYSWIYCGQAVSLLSRVLSLIPLYFIGKILVGGRKSLWGLLILIFLPYPAGFGSDVIRDWSHIFFLATGMALLIYGAKKGKCWMFGLAGLTAGLGYTIRPECAQVAIYGLLWLMICVITPTAETSRIKAGLLMLILLAGFAIPTAPFMKIRNDTRGAIPNKLKRVIPKLGSNIKRFPGNNETNLKYENDVNSRAEAISYKVLTALGRLVKEISENLIHFFTLPFIIGLYRGFSDIRKALFDERFFILCLLILYAIMMVLLYVNYDYISRRHCLPMVVFGIFYVPLGLELIAGWVEVNLFKNKTAGRKDIQRVFSILLGIGLAICIGKICRITPLRADKQSYRQAANWLKNNTTEVEKVAVFDGRIGLYSKRKCRIIRTTGKFPKDTDYVVKRFEPEETVPNGWAVCKKFTESEDKVQIYKRK